jgi:phosphatidylserine decarboxylase
MENLTQNYIVSSPSVVFVLASLIVVGIERQSDSIVYFAVILTLVCLFFFRPYLEQPSQNPGILVAPAEGHVQDIVYDQIDHTVTVQIYLSLLDKHVQIAPTNGTVVSQEYTSGTFLPAYMFEKSKYNERNSITFATDKGAVTVTQIAGILARRIVSFVKKEDQILKGQPIGIIKFGSRCDITFSSNCKLLVQKGQYIKLGQDLCIF